MKRIDHQTVQRILDAADIVDVVSEFVSLKRRGANYIGLCPFHNERTPSFSVSRARGICKCFSCGEGGSPINFLMKVESLTYVEALRWLAKKYNIEIQEEEVSEEERQAQSQRETMLTLNEWAMKHFEHNLTDTDDGRDIGLAYFRGRGINDAMVKRFHLGYSLDKRDDLLNAAHKAGFDDKYLVATGLCVQPEDGRQPYDRFRARVMYPVQGISGKVVAFGGRTLRSDKKMAKYVNSPESEIYSKSRELYGLYQAKNAIARKDKCILVEGYMDVISMHQVGVENVVASSGTSLTEGQIRLIHRFTRNVTVIYDSDPAGIKASLRGIDMLLAEDLDVKVLQLPEGDDPDSFAQSHSATEVEEYLNDNEQDFITFKISILLDEAKADPIARSKVVSDILRSISVIPNDITRRMYVQEVSRQFGLEEKMLLLELDKVRARNNEERAERARRDAARASLDNHTMGTAVLDQSQAAVTQQVAPTLTASATRTNRTLLPYEETLARYLVRYGLSDSQYSTLDVDGNPIPLRVVEYIDEIFRLDDLSFTDPVCNALCESVRQLLAGPWHEDYARAQAEADGRYAEEMAAGRAEIAAQAEGLADIEARETVLQAKCEARRDEALARFAEAYAERALCSSPDDAVRELATRLASDRHQLSKIHSKFAHVPTEEERLPVLLDRAIGELKSAILGLRIDEVKDLINKAVTEGASAEEITELMTRQKELMSVKNQLARVLGERIVNPR